MRSDDGVCSEWLEVAQGLPQGCVLSPQLVNVLIAAILPVAPENFSEDADMTRRSWASSRAAVQFDPAFVFKAITPELPSPSPGVIALKTDKVCVW